MYQKLQVKAAGTASWCTSVGNEKGKVPIPVLIESKGLEGLRPMALGLISKFFSRNNTNIHAIHSQI